MIPISNEDARIIQVLLERGHSFYRNHALKTCHINDGRRMAVMAGKLKRKINGTQRGVKYCEPSARTTNKIKQQ